MVYPPPLVIAERRREVDLQRGRQSVSADSYHLAEYTRLYSFYSGTKAAQRAQLAGMGVPVPETYTRLRGTAGMRLPTMPGSEGQGATRRPEHLVDRDASDARDHIEDVTIRAARRWIVRPLRHRGGQDYRLTDDPTDFIEGQEYIQRVYPKDREYRVIYCYGDPLIVMRKKNRTDIPQDQPWNHANGSYFQTINDVEGSRLGRTSFFYVMDTVPIIKSSHLVAVDVMYSNTLGFSVCEFNTCPGLQIEANLRKVASHVSSRCG